MPLPTERDQPWPPVIWREQARVWDEWDAWYSGDPARLLQSYGGNTAAPPVTRPSGWWQRLWWNQRNQEFQDSEALRRRRAHMHVPLPADIAATSAGLLFGEPPRITIPEAHLPNAPTDAKAAEDYVHRLIVEGDLFSRLLEGAESAAAMGGALLKPSWDVDVAPVPLLTIVQADNALPEFRYGHLIRCTLWRELSRNGNQQVLRHLEVHETLPDGTGVVFHGLYKGTQMTLGDSQPLINHSETAGLTPMVVLPFSGLGVEYIPNMRPYRRKRGSSLGQSDFAGVESIFDALDETYASWMRDIRLAKGRLMVPSEYIDKLGVFDAEQEVFVPLDVDPMSRQGAGGGITVQQFAIRVDEHERTALHWIERGVGAAGYSPQTFGLHIEGRAESGIALKIRENKTLTTQQRKSQWWSSGIESALFKMVMIGRNIFNEPGLTAYRPQAEMADSLPENPMELAQTISTLDNARAISTDTKVRMAHPDWDEEQIVPEVQRVMAEQGLVVPDPDAVDVMPPLTPELTGQIGELYRAGWTGASIIEALRTGDMTKLVQRPGVQPITLGAETEPAGSAQEPEVEVQVGAPPPPVAGAGFGG